LTAELDAADFTNLLFGAQLKHGFLLVAGKSLIADERRKNE
jgi:hypothetical protein